MTRLDELEGDSSLDENPAEDEKLKKPGSPTSPFPVDVSVLKKIRINIEGLKRDTVTKFDEQLTSMVDEIMTEVEESALFPCSTTSKRSKSNGPKKPHPDYLPEKEFIIRESILTDLLEVKHIQTIYHIFVAILIILFLQTFLYDLVETGRFYLDYSMIKYSFGKIQLVMTVWLTMKLSVILFLFPIFHYWAHNHSKLFSLGIPHSLFLFLFIFYLTMFMVLPPRTIIQEKIPTASAAIILCEQVRLIMKSYAFVRSNVPRAMKFKPHQDGDKSETVDSPCPDFSKFLYFLFAPTLVYRDEYPRNKYPIRWRYVATNLIQVVACLFYTFYIFNRFCVPVFRRFGHEAFSFRGLLLSIFGCMMPGTLVLIINFFLILHAWMNAFAEMLRFGDRQFYKDWWNSTAYSNYYRTWNTIVHDWLYAYVYKDIYQLTRPNRRIPMFTVFMLSALVHEYMVSFMFSFFYPILFLLFGGFGVLFVFITDKRKSRTWNIFFWVTYFIGPGILMTLYSTEIYARTNCPPFHESFLDFFVPRSWVCSNNSSLIN